MCFDSGGSEGWGGVGVRVGGRATIPSLDRTLVQLANLNHTDYTAGIAKYVQFLLAAHKRTMCKILLK